MQSTGMILYILLFGMIAGGIWTGLNRNHTEYSMTSYSLKSVFFFFSLFYFVVSVIKFYLGEAEITLTESFWDVEGRTYLHYVILFGVVAFGVLLVMKRWIPSYGYHLVPVFDFVLIIAIVIDMLLFGRIDNRNYSILFVICMLASGILLVWGRIGSACHQQMKYVNRKELYHCFLEALPFMGAGVVMTGLYLPNELYIHLSLIHISEPTRR